MNVEAPRIHVAIRDRYRSRCGVGRCFTTFARWGCEAVKEEKVIAFIGYYLNAFLNRKRKSR